MEAEAADQPDKAPQACVSCRKQKRKCDKLLPSCSLCIRMSRPCDYSETAPIPTSEDFAAMRQKIADLEARLEGRRSEGGHGPMRSFSASPGIGGGEAAFATDSNATFPAAFFLDAEVFVEAQLTIPRPNIAVPPEVAATVGVSILDIQEIVDRYFANIHTWLPFVSKKRMQLTLSNPTMELTLDLALLLLSMKLVIQVPQSGPQSIRSPLYNLSKGYANMVESSGLMSLQLLQANILVAAYEIGHAIYPAAYLSTGHCARIGHALGLNDRRHAPQMLKKRTGAWGELEEMKRTWWATMLLDRYVNLGSSGHPLATDDPVLYDTLPADDDLWDEGQITTSEPLYVSSPTNVKAGAFTRTCQATHLLGRLVRLLNDRLLDAPMRFSEAIQLHRTLQALANLLPNDVHRSPERYGTPLAICYSSLMHLCDPFACTESNGGHRTVEETEMQTIAIAGMKSVAADVFRFSQLLHVGMTSNPAAVSPLVGDCIYFGASIYAWLAHETGLREMGDAYHILRKVLETMASRWAVGQQYLTLLDISKESLYADSQFV
ncbi:uncharacterized protein A1O5_08139 [Cladophialophora psammophila CBS 110553]|uniref:Zn(2)-C6 fungal-type domain-containing protein n=1 Tax=Cladophialophora psammophila CBS 110553 TaxID=1182543 RepID=W9WJQ9_9EURO|nr:uncharacterized protein A1O5_08139 [Cladophialophora psammophila CBS 110553]EXJ68347.1 hypothetical protein A1O5_08139 [Cladophialophora psammophila CBS 110553]